METNLMTHRPHVDTNAQQVVALFEAHHEEVFAYVYRMVDDAEWAHDITQDAFLRLYETRKRLEGVENQRAWVYRIATNTAINALKKRRRFNWLPWRDDDIRQHDALAPAGPEDQLDLGRGVTRALASLTPTYRAPLLLFTQFDFSVHEIAQALNTSDGAIKTRLFRAREMFRAAYEQEQSGEKEAL